MSTITLNQRTDYVVRTAVGAALYTTDSQDLALKFARENRERWPGLYVETVTVNTTTRRLWTDRMSIGRAA